MNGAMPMKETVTVPIVASAHVGGNDVEPCDTVKSRWFRRSRNTIQPRRLFAFPCAGGSARMFRKWQDWLPDLEVVAVELPGRGIHRCHPPVEHMDELIDRLLPALDPLLDVPFAVFGHSMGALVAFEWSCALRRTGRRSPEHVFVSGMRAPHLIQGQSRVHALPEPEFLQAVESLRGIPAEVMEHESLVRHFLPVLRTDLRLAETYRCRERALLRHPITVFAGLDDPTTSTANLDEWSFHTGSFCTVRLMEGDHFFIHQHAHVMAASIVRCLGALPSPPPDSPAKIREFESSVACLDPLMDRPPATQAPSAVVDGPQ